MEIDKKKKNNKIRWPYLILSIILWFLVFAWMWIIFMLSSENGFSSSERSMIAHNFIENFLNIQVSHVLVRKSAHLIEYAILTSLSFFSFAASSRISAHNPLIEISKSEMLGSFQTHSFLSMWITVLFAVIDEYHQIFVYSRNASVVDVLIDVAGGLCMLFIFRFFLFLFSLRKMLTKKFEHTQDSIETTFTAK